MLSPIRVEFSSIQDYGRNWFKIK